MQRKGDKIMKTKGGSKERANTYSGGDGYLKLYDRFPSLEDIGEPASFEVTITRFSFKVYFFEKLFPLLKRGGFLLKIDF